MTQHNIHTNTTNINSAVQCSMRSINKCIKWLKNGKHRLQNGKNMVSCRHMEHICSWQRDIFAQCFWWLAFCILSAALPPFTQGPGECFPKSPLQYFFFPSVIPMALYLQTTTALLQQFSRETTAACHSFPLYS